MRRPAELLIVRNVRAYDLSIELDETVDAVVEAGILTRLGRDAGESLATSARARVVDGTGRWLLPGFVELGAHLGEPGLEYKEDLASGLFAAAAGGFTRVCCSPDTDPINDGPVVTRWLVDRAREVSPVRLLPVASATQRLEGRALSEMGALRDAGAVAVGDAARSIADSQVLRRVLEYARDCELPVFQHPEDRDLTRAAEMNEGPVATRLGLRGAPAVAEEVVVARDVALAEHTGGRYHAARVSTRRSVQTLRDARARGARVSCAVPVHHLVACDEALEGYDPSYKLTPPLRSRLEMEALREALDAGEVDAVSSDHRPQSPLEKDCDFASAEFGAVGLSTCASLLLELVLRGRVSLASALRALTIGPASVLGVPAPRLALGEPAECVLWAPDAEWRVEPGPALGKSRNTPFLGQTLTGCADLTLAAGHVAFDRLGEGAHETPSDR